jgi:hypothetical protein
VKRKERFFCFSLFDRGDIVFFYFDFCMKLNGGAEEGVYRVIEGKKVKKKKGVFDV